MRQSHSHIPMHPVEWDPSGGCGSSSCGAVSYRTRDGVVLRFVARTTPISVAASYWLRCPLIFLAFPLSILHVPTPSPTRPPFSKLYGGPPWSSAADSTGIVLRRWMWVVGRGWHSLIIYIKVLEINFLTRACFSVGVDLSIFSRKM